ncbi:MAG: hypothetical protein LBC13_04200 [Clostridiales bacterium]|jgi:predicted ribosome quality control (RQC) complex YloA/Tae2 family protein|nr:hypothetical protein [Clostridiales bacterium]
MAGRNNLQNDELTFKIASSEDIWLHIKNAHGSHVIIFTDTAGKRPHTEAKGKAREAVPEEVLLFAVKLAAAGAVGAEVDYTERKNVRRQRGGYPGMVTYTDYKTIRTD